MINIDFSQDYLVESKQVSHQINNQIHTTLQQTYASGIQTEEERNWISDVEFQSQFIHTRGKSFHEGTVRYWIDEFYIDKEGYPHEEKRSYVLNAGFIPTLIKGTGKVIYLPKAMQDNGISISDVEAELAQQKEKARED